MWTRSCSVFRFGLLGRAPAEAQSLRLSAAVAAAFGSVPRGQRALLDADMNALIDRLSCLVDPVPVGGALFAISRARAVRTDNVQRRVRSLLTKIPIARPCGKSCAPEMLVPKASVIVVHSRPLQDPSCSGRSSPHVVFLQLLTKSSSRATWAFLSHNVVIPRVARLCL